MEGGAPEGVVGWGQHSESGVALEAPPRCSLSLPSQSGWVYEYGKCRNIEVSPEGLLGVDMGSQVICCLWAGRLEGPVG